MFYSSQATLLPGGIQDNGAYYSSWYIKFKDIQHVLEIYWTSVENNLTAG